MPVQKYPPNPLGICILSEFYKLHGKDISFKSITEYLDSLELAVYNPYHMLKKKEVDKVHGFFNDLALYANNRIRSFLPFHRCNPNEMIHMINDATHGTIQTAGLNRIEKNTVHLIVDRINDLLVQLDYTKHKKNEIPELSRAVVDLSRELMCVSCRETLRDPRVLRCGHACCFECVRSWFETTQFTTCPYCRQMDIVGNVDKLTYMPLLDSVIRINAQMMKCLAKYDPIPEPPFRPACSLCVKDNKSVDSDSTTDTPKKGKSKSKTSTAGKVDAENTNDLTHSQCEADDAAQKNVEKSSIKSSIGKLWYDDNLQLFMCSWCYDTHLLKGTDLSYQHPVFFDLLQDISGQSTQFCEQHGFQIRNYWCHDCHVSSCIVCEPLHHRNHRTTLLSPEEALVRSLRDATYAYDFYKNFVDKVKTSIQEQMDKMEHKVMFIVQSYDQLSKKWQTENGKVQVDSLIRKHRLTCENVGRYMSNQLQNLSEEIRVCQTATQISTDLKYKKMRMRLHVGNLHAKKILEEISYCRGFYTSFMDDVYHTKQKYKALEGLVRDIQALMSQDLVRDRLRHMAREMVGDINKATEQQENAKNRRKDQELASGEHSCNDTEDFPPFIARSSERSGLGQPRTQENNEQSDIRPHKDHRPIQQQASNKDDTGIQILEVVTEVSDYQNDETDEGACAEVEHILEPIVTSPISDHAQDYLEYKNKNLRNFLLQKTAQDLVTSIYGSLDQDTSLEWEENQDTSYEEREEETSYEEREETSYDNKEEGICEECQQHLHTQDVLESLENDGYDADEESQNVIGENLSYEDDGTEADVSQYSNLETRGSDSSYTEDYSEQDSKDEAEMIQEAVQRAEADLLDLFVEVQMKLSNVDDENNDDDNDDVKDDSIQQVESEDGQYVSLEEVENPDVAEDKPDITYDDPEADDGVKVLEKDEIVPIIEEETGEPIDPKVEEEFEEIVEVEKEIIAEVEEQEELEEKEMLGFVEQKTETENIEDNPKRKVNGAGDVKENESAEEDLETGGQENKENESAEEDLKTGGQENKENESAEEDLETGGQENKENESAQEDLETGGQENKENESAEEDGEKVVQEYKEKEDTGEVIEIQQKPTALEENEAKEEMKDEEVQTIQETIVVDDSCQTTSEDITEPSEQVQVIETEEVETAMEQTETTEKQTEEEHDEPDQKIYEEKEVEKCEATDIITDEEKLDEKIQENNDKEVKEEEEKQTEARKTSEIEESNDKQDAQPSQPEAKHEEEKTQPKQEKEKTQPKQEEEKTQPNQEEEKTKPKQKEEKTQPKQKEEKTQPKQEEEKTQPKQEEEKTQPKQEEEKKQPKQEEEKTQLKQEEEKTAPEKEEEQPQEGSKAIKADLHHPAEEPGVAKEADTEKFQDYGKGKPLGCGDIEEGQKAPLADEQITHSGDSPKAECGSKLSDAAEKGSPCKQNKKKKNRKKTNKR